MKTVKVKTAKIEDSRLVKSRGESHTDRTRQERVILGDRELTDSQRLEAFRMNLFNSQLPDLPAIPGYHVCWLTTNNRQDPIHGRMRVGYELIKADDLPGFESVSVKTGDWAGFIMVNEMIAAKLPIRLYQAFMTEVHHKQPLDEASKLTQATLEMQEQLSKKGLKPSVGQGTLELSRDPGAPDFGRLHGETGKPYRPFELEKKMQLQESLQESEAWEEGE
jgi:hypothetical protein